MPVTTSKIPIIPDIFNCSLNKNTESSVAPTIPKAHQVAYTTDKFIYSNDFERKKKHMQYARTVIMLGINLLNPSEYFKNIVPTNSPIIPRAK
jgi:hypothetical protein